MGEQVAAGSISNLLMRFKSIEYQKPKGVSRGGVAQLGEHLPCKQGVKSSNLSISTGREAGRLEDMTGERIKSVSQDTYLENRILNENKYQDIRGRTERSVRIKLENKEARKRKETQEVQRYAPQGQAGKSIGWMPWH